MPDELFGELFYGEGRRGPYGTNPGDTWFASDEMNRLIKEDKGPGYAVIIWICDDKSSDKYGQETVYCTENVELIEEARQGTIKWAQAHARRN